MTRELFDLLGIGLLLLLVGRTGLQICLARLKEEPDDPNWQGATALALVLLVLGLFYVGGCWAQFADTLPRGGAR